MSESDSPNDPGSADLAELLTKSVHVGGLKLSASAPAKGKVVREVRRQGPPPWRQPGVLHVSGDGALWVLDRPESQRFRLTTIDASGKEADWTAGHGTGDGELAEPAALAVDGDGNVWIVDAQENCLKKFAGDGQWLETMRAAGSMGKLFNYPQDVVVDGNGFLYVADTLNSRVVKLSSEGELVWAVEKLQLPSGESDELYEPCSLAWSTAGVLWVTDRPQNRVLGLDERGKVVRAWPTETVSFPVAVRTAPGGQVVVADHHFQRVRRFEADGTAAAVLEFPLTAENESYQGGGPIAVNGAGEVLAIDMQRESVLVTTLGEVGS